MITETSSIRIVNCSIVIWKFSHSHKATTHEKIRYQANVMVHFHFSWKYSWKHFAHTSVLLHNVQCAERTCERADFFARLQQRTLTQTYRTLQKRTLTNCYMKNVFNNVLNCSGNAPLYMDQERANLSDRSCSRNNTPLSATIRNTLKKRAIGSEERFEEYKLLIHAVILSAKW